ncbi:helix-turn-helix domain-containing protein [Brevundimonas variabilis]|uniref:LuxR family quorum-sensing system transcriptional regulator CciR n=1 Tax=Brevundimonas variabilis TaxID=74312 RepID=A0A7W9CK93_9CAUL|nr:helix-turn-helix transcriptional regulator [Brevundimonas variabilis]MBB5747091.1 LuxR family quorum-sensing system transcriptional regulator CciR [Brevundimonas variabilis]
MVKASEIMTPDHQTDVGSQTFALSPRELECLLWVSRGKSSGDIGAILGLSPRTVDSYLEKVCAKLRVRTRIEAVALAVRAGTIEPD